MQKSKSTKKILEKIKKCRAEGILSYWDEVQLNSYTEKFNESYKHPHYHSDKGIENPSDRIPKYFYLGYLTGSIKTYGIPPENLAQSVIDLRLGLMREKINKGYDKDIVKVISKLVGFNRLLKKNDEIEQKLQSLIQNSDVLDKKVSEYIEKNKPQAEKLEKKIFDFYENAYKTYKSKIQEIIADKEKTIDAETLAVCVEMIKFIDKCFSKEKNKNLLSRGRTLKAQVTLARSQSKQAKNELKRQRTLVKKMNSELKIHKKQLKDASQPLDSSVRPRAFSLSGLIKPVENESAEKSSLWRRFKRFLKPVNKSEQYVPQDLSSYVYTQSEAGPKQSARPKIIIEQSPFSKEAISPQTVSTACTLSKTAGLGEKNISPNQARRKLIPRTEGEQISRPRDLVQSPKSECFFTSPDSAGSLNPGLGGLTAHSPAGYKGTLSELLKSPETERSLSKKSIFSFSKTDVNSRNELAPSSEDKSPVKQPKRSPFLCFSPRARSKTYAAKDLEKGLNALYHYVGINPNIHKMK